MELSHVELQAYDGEHEDGHEQQQANLQQGDHSLHNRLEHHLQAWRTQCKTKSQWRSLELSQYSVAVTKRMQ